MLLQIFIFSANKTFDQKRNHQILYRTRTRGEVDGRQSRTVLVPAEGSRVRQVNGPIEELAEVAEERLVAGVFHKVAVLISHCQESRLKQNVKSLLPTMYPSTPSNSKQN